MAAAVNAMTALGAMLAMAWAASSGPDITPWRSPVSVGPASRAVVDMPWYSYGFRIRE
jgi:hypothetical protein